MPITAIIMRITEQSRTSRLAPILQLTSPALPVGAYAYSNGLEFAVNEGWVHDSDSAQRWIDELATNNICMLDLPVLLRLHECWHSSDLSQIRYWAQFLNASRGSLELLQEDQHLGVALARLLADLGVTDAREWIDCGSTNWAVMFSLAATRWDINVDDMLFGYLWTWCENQVMAAVKLVPLGQTAGQKMLFEIGERIPDMVDSCRSLRDEEIGQNSVALMIASALHEEQYSRLFRS